MLTLFTSFRCPEVPHVDIFRDSEKPQKFHLLNTLPRIAVDPVSGDPQFNFTLIARDPNVVFASLKEGQPMQLQVGTLNMMVDLHIPTDDMEKIRRFLQAKLRGERQRRSHYNILFKRQTSVVEPEIGYVDSWVQGTAQLDMLNALGDTFVREASQQVQPSLRSTNGAALWATFGSEGSQLLWGALHPGEDAGEPRPDGAVPIQANIRYDLEGIARAPELNVTISANGEAVYKEIRERIRVRETHDGKTYRYPQISELTKELVDNRVIEVKWNDFGIPASEPGADDIKEMLQTTVLGVLTNQIVGSFFDQIKVQGLQEDDLGETFTHTLGGIPGSKLWLKEYKEEFVSNIDFSLSYATNVRFTAHPQTSLMAKLTPDQIQRLVRVIDVGDPEIQMMTVQVLTNADFEKDDIAHVAVELEYNQVDHITGPVHFHDAHVFQQETDSRLFRFRIAREDERLLDTYDAKATLTYRATSQNPQEIVLKDINDRVLTFSYDLLGYIKVDVQAGDINWDQIEQVFVDFRYRTAGNQPDTEFSLELNADIRTGSWTSSKHGQTSNKYEYTVKYIFKDGHEVVTDRETDHRGSLIIHDTLVGRIRRTFDVVFDPNTVNAIYLKVRYEETAGEGEETSKILSSTGSWEFLRPVSEGATKDLKYRYIVEYKDGHVEEIEEWLDLPDGTPLETIIARRYPLSVYVDGGGIDWAKWRRVAVEITYKDDTHVFQRTNSLILDPEKNFLSTEFATFSPALRDYHYRAQFAPKDPATTQPQDIEGTGNGMLLLETIL